ncbi:MAG: hypothetical protein COV75_07825 [Candidatus Omnitrophica bacterium CG11_big_fil_rev_8_21_14_0_20_63_9]|nr:MAG: hypothetical protein COV75_07825 [Candidatus Omnitrophica bacterium CG11_big_fil_rev_8_21_14_0_20_63_9]
MIIQQNFVKEKLAQGQPVLGTWHTLASPLVTEALAHAGLDFLILDFEHGPFALDTVHEHVVRCERHRCSPIVRLPVPEAWMVLQALDQGAHGVMVPQVHSAHDARRLIEAAKYPPQGSRGFSPFSRAGGFTNLDAATYPARANTFTLTATIVESRRGMEALKEILTLEDLDVVYFGAYDLSQEAGVPGDWRHAKVLPTITRGVQQVAAAGKAAGGIVAESQDDVKRLLDMGMRFITYDVDSAILARPVQRLAEWFAKERKA